MLDIFKDDAFSLTALTKAIQDTPYVPGQVGRMGLFPEQGIATLSIAIERVGMGLSLVKSRPRGAPAEPKTRDKRKMLDIRATHLPQRAHVNADEVQGVRAFGTENQLETVQAAVNKHLARMRRDLDFTMEYHKLGAIMGVVLDADGDELWDFFDIFGFTKTTHAMDLDDTNVDIRVRCHELSRKVEAKIGGKPYSGIHALCSPGFFDAFVKNADVKKAYDRYQDGEFLRKDLHNSKFPFGGVIWEEYKGSAGGDVKIPDDKAIGIPLGVPDMFGTYFAPADYNETVNTVGLPYYAKMQNADFDKGVEMESQSNPIHINTQPDAVVEISLT